MNEINAEHVIRELAKRCELKTAFRKGEIAFCDESGVETRSKTDKQIADMLYDEIFESGKYEGKKQAVSEICDHARLL